MISKFRKSRKGFRHSLFFSVFFSVLLGILVFGVVGFLIVSNWRINQRRQELHSRIEFLKNEIERLEQEKTEMQAQMSQSGSDFYVEKEARERFNLKAPGEEVVTILPAEEKEELPQEEESKWWDPFGW